MDPSDDERPVGRRSRWLLRLVRYYVGPGPYLDFGCGTGRLLPGLSAHGSASGFEPSEPAAAVARAASPGCPVHTELADIPHGVFRGITAINALDPLDPDAARATLDCWHEVLVPDGRALVLVRNREDTAGDATPVGTRPHEEWRALLSGAGFQVVREGGDGVWTEPRPAVPRFLRSVPEYVQSATGRLFLRPGSGEGSVFLLERAG